MSQLGYAQAFVAVPLIAITFCLGDQFSLKIQIFTMALAAASRKSDVKHFGHAVSDTMYPSAALIWYSWHRLGVNPLCEGAGCILTCQTFTAIEKLPFKSKSYRGTSSNDLDFFFIKLLFLASCERFDIL